MKPLSQWFSEMTAHILLFLLHLYCIKCRCRDYSEETLPSHWKGGLWRWKMNPIKKFRGNSKTNTQISGISRIFYFFPPLLTSSCDVSVSNPNPENPGVLQSEFKQNGKAGDLVSAVPPCGEPLGLKLKQHENPVLRSHLDSDLKH